MLVSAIKQDLCMFFMQERLFIKGLKGKLAFLKAWLDVDFRIVFWFRIYSALVRTPLKTIGILLYLRVKSRYGVDISPWAKIGPGFRLMHGFGVVIGPSVYIGDYCKVFNNATFGKKRPDNAENAMPTVGDFCIVGTGAKILGNISVCSYALIGANAVVLENITDKLVSTRDRPIRVLNEEYVERLKCIKASFKEEAL